LNRFKEKIEISKISHQYLYNQLEKQEKINHNHRISARAKTTDRIKSGVISMVTN